MLLIFFIIFCVKTALSLDYLTNTQWKQIRYILKHPDSTKEMVSTCRGILYKHYKDYACNKAYEFKHKYSIKCKHIPLEEMKLYALRGLMLAIKNYDSRYHFSGHVSIYIKGELHKGMSEMHPLTLLSESNRITRKWRNDNIVLYKKMIHTKFISNYVYYDSLYKSDLQDNYMKNICYLWEMVKQMDIEYQNIMKYKYNIYFKQIRSNKEIGDILNCSHETIRKKVSKIKKELYNESNYIYNENKNKNTLLI